MFEIRDHTLYRDGARVPYRATPNKSGKIKPQILILHDTAGRLDANSSVSWLISREAKASAHLVIGREGEVTQLAPFSIATWHAGKSSYKGRRNCNGFSIGIEIVNPGAMTDAGGGKAKAWFKQLFDIADYGIRKVSTKQHGSGLWMPYTDAQIEVVTAIARELVREYQLTDITTHWFVSPGRKVDTNPLFPLDDLRAAAMQALPAVSFYGPVGDGPGEESGADAADVAAAPAPDRELVTFVQRRLRELGYYVVGEPDGDAGQYTGDAIQLFRQHNGLPDSRAIDDALIAALISGKPYPVPEGRRNASLATVTARVPAAKASWWAKAKSFAVAAGAFVSAAVAALVETFKDLWDQTEGVRSMLGHIPVYVWLIGLGAIALWMLKNNKKAEDEIVDAYRKGALR